MKLSRRGLVAIFVALFAVVGIAAGIIWMNHPISMSVENMTKASLSDVSVIVGERKFDFGDLTHGEKKSVWFFYDGPDSSFQVSAKHADGTLINESLGYITSGVSTETAVLKFHENYKVSLDHRP